LVPLAGAICQRYMGEFPDEHERYGPAEQAWCLHDNQYLLAWAIQDARDGTVDVVEQALWLRDVLNRRGFPVERLARDLDIAASVVGKVGALASLAPQVAGRLADAAAAVRAAGT
ncbi:MAG: hypothetical protein ACYDA6_11460, partial [Solirubrobacteraceae bacterium]